MLLPENVFCTYFIHVIPHTDESGYNVAQKKFYAHTDFENLEGALPDTNPLFLGRLWHPDLTLAGKVKTLPLVVLEWILGLFPAST